MKKNLPTIMSLLIALLLFAAAVVRVFLGYVPSSRPGHKAITAAANPVSFWITVVFILLIAFVFLVLGVVSFFKNKKSLE